MENVTKTDEEWREELGDERYQVLRCAGTEPPFSGEYTYSKDDGIYRCGACGAELFSSDAKFDSGTGWPSFTEPAIAENVEVRPDHSHGMVRDEVLCRRCGSHLGHVFPDGPGPTGQRLLHQLAGAGPGHLRRRPPQIADELSGALQQPPIRTPARRTLPRRTPKMRRLRGPAR